MEENNKSTDEQSEIDTDSTADADTTDDEEAEAIAKRHKAAAKVLKRYCHTSLPLTESINAVLPPLEDVNGTPDDDAAKLTLKAGAVLDLLGERSVRWGISIHWLYTVCNPAIFPYIDDGKGGLMFNPNSKSSPVYANHAAPYPLGDRFGELSHLDDTLEGLIEHRDKVVPDKRFIDADVWNFGSAWDDDGVVIKTDADGHPKLDGFAGWVANHITILQDKHLAKKHVDGHFRAFMIAHSRDTQECLRNSDSEHTPTHLQIYLDNGGSKISRRVIMEAMGVNFDDYRETFDWIKKLDLPDCDAKQKAARVKAFLSTLESLAKNYECVNAASGMQKYVVHQTKSAQADQKIQYSTKEVIAWLPEDPHLTYESIANTYDSDVSPRGVEDAILSNLNSPYNRAHHSKKLVGKKNQNKRYTYRQLSELRALGKKKPGSASFTAASQRNITNLLMSWIRETDMAKPHMQVGEWQSLIHMAFDDTDADLLLSNKRFIEPMQTLIDSEVQAVIDDPDYIRGMLTITIIASTGGIGKTFLATALAKYYTQGRKPHSPQAVPQKGLTFDPYGNYLNQLASILDELPGWAFGWEILKSLLEQEKIPDLPARYHNKLPWAVHWTFITNVFLDGISRFVRDVLQFAKGAGSHYLEKDPDGDGLRLIENDTQAAKEYLSNLSQLVRRLPVYVKMDATDSGTGFIVTVSVPNVRAGHATTHYDYVHTADSVHRFNLLLTPDTSEADVERVAKTVATMIDDLRAKAHDVFVADPSAQLETLPDFIADNCDFGVRLNQLSGEPTLVNDAGKSPQDTGDAPSQDLVRAFRGSKVLAKTFVRFVLNHGHSPLPLGKLTTPLKPFNGAFHRAKYAEEKRDVVGYFFKQPYLIQVYLDCWHDCASSLSDTDMLTLLALRAGLDNASLADLKALDASATTP